MAPAVLLGAGGVLPRPVMEYAVLKLLESAAADDSGMDGNTAEIS